MTFTLTNGATRTFRGTRINIGEMVENDPREREREREMTFKLD